MRIAWVRLILAAIAAEACAILILVAAVALFGPGEPNAAQLFAERLGRFVGPIAGTLLGLAGGYLIARRLNSGQLLHGALFGVVFAATDVVLLLAAQAAFEWLFVASNATRIVSGTLGGMLATKFAPQPPTHGAT
ncbi:MAG: hypothetical protein ABR589_08775 [Chthoniobacterales bacterium]